MFLVALLRVSSSAENYIFIFGTAVNFLVRFFQAGATSTVMWLICDSGLRFREDVSVLNHTGSIFVHNFTANFSVASNGTPWPQVIFSITNHLSETRLFDLAVSCFRRNGHRMRQSGNGHVIDIADYIWTIIGRGHPLVDDITTYFLGRSVGSEWIRAFSTAEETVSDGTTVAFSWQGVAIEGTATRQLRVLMGTGVLDAPPSVAPPTAASRPVCGPALGLTLGGLFAGITACVLGCCFCRYAEQRDPWEEN
jgi:hypothetical protein